MAYGSARAFAAGFRALGVDADVDAAFRRPHARTGRALHLRRRMLSRQGDGGRLHEACWSSRTSTRRRPCSSCPPPRAPAASASTRPICGRCWTANGYGQTSRSSRPPATTPTAAWATSPGRSCAPAWRALVAADILQKMLLKHRPYETAQGAADAAYEECLDDLCRRSRRRRADPAVQLQRAARLPGARAATGSARVPAQRDRGDAADRRGGRDLLPAEHVLQRGPGAAPGGVRRRGLAVSDIAEWIWYTNSEHFRKLQAARAGLYRSKMPGRLDPQARPARATSTCCWSRSTRISSATRSRTSTRCWSWRGPTCRATARWARWC